LHIHDMVIAESAFYANRNFKLPVILDLHENRPEIMRDYKHVKSLSGRLLINIERWKKKYYDLGRQADRVIVVTEASKTDIIERTGKAPDRIVVVPNTVHLNEFLSHPVQSEITARMHGSYNLLYIGDTSIRRGTDTAIVAVSLLKNKIPNIKLWLIGKSSADKVLHKIVLETDVCKNVMFEGWRDPSTFLSYLQNIDVSLSPIKRNLHHDTTYANKLFQYMVSGRPLIVSDCTAQADLVLAEDCGLVHRAGDPEDLAEKILFLHNNIGRAKELGANGKKAVEERWNWKLTVQPLMEMYRALSVAK
jgi:glycosyltransferase involved in cell wall biosynthesis